MKILNLTNLETSDIKYQVSKFPDGQQQLTIKDKNLGGNFYNINVHIKSIEIKARLNNFKDLELIICATKSLRTLGVKEIHLYAPYFLGSRSDRKFEEGSNNYLKNVICPIINSLNFESVTVLDPHSHVLEACLNNFRQESNVRLTRFALETIYEFKNGLNTQTKEDPFILVSPDAGATHKIYKLAEQIGYKGDIITCSKERDANGKLTKVVVPKVPIDKDIIIIDDICDGGNTFINIAKKLNDGKGKLYLIVTHGIFSNRFDELGKYFDSIYCTNSYRDLPRIDVTGLNQNFYKQLNVF